jgi:RsiW-degrading membrane proteinase PrsW (M82 family)
MTIFLVVLSVFAASIPMVSYLLLLRWLDRYEPEPLHVVAAAFLWGAIPAVLIGGVGSLIMTVPLVFIFDESQVMFLSGAVVAPFMEEGAKAGCLLLLYFTRNFDNPTDGFVYGAAAGLGFAMSENFLYFASMAEEGIGAWVATVVMRTLFTGLMHATASSIIGAGLGWAKFSRNRYRLLALPLSFLAAVAVHAVWNAFLLAPLVFEAGTALPVVSFLLFPFEFIAIFLVFQGSLLSESRLIKRELQLEADLGTLPSAHVEKVASWLSRRKHANWLSKEVAAEAYFQSATLLAFRRNQHAVRPNDKTYAEDVVRLRASVVAILSGNPTSDV